MATVDELIVQIKADTKDLNKKLTHTNKQLNKTGKEAENAGKKLKAGLSKGKVAAVAITAVLVKLATHIAKVGMEFEDLKDSLDTVFGSMKDGDKAMKRVFEFASTTPFQVETVTKAFIALKSVGIEPTNDMLQTFADTASVSVDQLGVFEALVRTVQRSAAGGLGLEELNMLSDRGIPALKILSEELNLSKDDIAKFGKTVEGARLITDALQEGLNKRFGGAMESKMDNLSTKTSNMTIAFKQLADEIFKSGLGEFFGALADSLKDAAEQAARAIAATQGRGTGVVLRNPNQDVGKNATPDQKKRSRLATVQANIDDLRAAASPLETKAAKQLALDKSPLGRTGLMSEFHITSEEQKQLGLINDDLEEQIELLDRIKTGKGLISEEDKASLMRQGELQQGLTFITGLINKELGATNDLAFAKENLTTIYTENQEALNLLGFDEQKIIDLLDKHAKKTEKVATFSEEMQQAIASSAATFSKEFVDSLLEGENALASFQNLAKNIVSQIISTFLQLAVVNKILNAVFGAGTFDELDLSTGKVVKANAGGGTVQKGQPTLVGERGAEIFVPNTGGTIMNNMNSKNAMGGGAPIIVNQSVNFATGVVPTVRAEVQKMLPQISDVTKGAVLEAAVRGGSYRKGLIGRG